MRVAVTGARGFIGRHVLAELTSRGIEHVATSTQSTVAALPAAARRTWVTLDMQQAPDDPYGLLGEPDVVIHLAWRGLPHYRSLHHFEQELPVQYAFLRGLVGQGLRNLVCTGTCFEYGFQSGPLRPDADARPANPYGFAKHALHRMLDFLRSEQAFNLTWARIFYLYGAGQASSSLYSQLRAAVEAGAKSFDLSGGEQLRDFMPVEAAAARLVDLALGATHHGTVNVCSGRPMSVRTLVETLVRENGWRIELKFGKYPYPDYEPLAFWGADAATNPHGQV